MKGLSRRALMKRRLAAIVAADMAGYSRLMEQDEEGVLIRQKLHRHELIDPEIDERGGRIVKTTGDGVLVGLGAGGGPMCTQHPAGDGSPRSRHPGHQPNRLSIRH